MPRVVGLTGGIGSGKSTVARLLRELGAEVIDADQVARDVVEPGQPALAEIVTTFGHEVVTSDGRLDRKRLAARVFSDEAARKSLNAITHPRIAIETANRIRAAGERGAEVVLYEATLLVENGMHKMLDGLVVVACDVATQLARVRARDGMDDEEAKKRVAAQLPLSDKIAVADRVIVNDGTVEELRPKVGALWQELRAGSIRTAARG